MRAFKELFARLQATHAFRAWKRYGDANGDLLAAGVGYFAFFSIFPAVALAFAAFGFALQGRPELLDTIANSLNDILPGMVKTDQNATGVISLSAPEIFTLTITGVISFVTLVFSGLGWIGALRTGIRGVFGLVASTGNVVTAKLRDLGVLLALGLGIAVSAVLTSVVGGLTEQVARWVGLEGNTVLVTLVGLLIGVVFDTTLMVVLLRLLSGVPLPWANVRGGAIVGAVLLTAMKYFAGVLIGRVTGNPLLGAVAVAVGLLFWLNLMSRVVLLSAAWAANGLDVARLAGEAPESASDAGADSGERALAGKGVLGAGEGSLPSVQGTDRSLPYAGGLAPEATVGPARDRGTLAVGAALGAVGTLVLQTLRRRRDKR